MENKFKLLIEKGWFPTIKETPTEKVTKILDKVIEDYIIQNTKKPEYIVLYDIDVINAISTSKDIYYQGMTVYYKGIKVFISHKELINDEVDIFVGDVEFVCN